MKKTLMRSLTSTVFMEKPMLIYMELQTILTEVSNIINDRPVCLKSLTEEDLLPLMVNQLLLGRNSNQSVTYDKEGKLHRLQGIQDIHQQVLQSWWKLWKEQSFPHLLLFNHAEDVTRQVYLKEGDICMLNYKMIIKSYYWLCVVMRAEAS